MEDPPESFIELSYNEWTSLIVYRDFWKIIVISAIRNCSAIYFFLNSKRILLLIVQRNDMADIGFLLGIGFQFLGYKLAKYFWKKLEINKMFYLATLLNLVFCSIGFLQHSHLQTLVAMICINRLLYGAFYIYDTNTIFTMFQGDKIVSLNKVFNVQFSLAMLMAFAVNYFLPFDQKAEAVFGVFFVLDVVGGLFIFSLKQF